MSNPSKQKGTQFESSLLPALKKLDPRVERAALHGALDRGDFSLLRVPQIWRDSGYATMVISAKNCKAMDLSGWINEVEKQRHNAAADVGIVCHKRRGTTEPLRQYTTMELDTLLKLLGAQP